MHGTLTKSGRREISSADLDLVEELAAAEARESFLSFRYYMNPQLIRGWWQDLCCIELQNFFEEILAGKRPCRLFGAPPQHGKSDIISDFAAWCAGKQTNWPILFSSYAEELCTRTNLKLQSYFLDPRYQHVFPELRVRRNLPEDLDIAVKPQQNTEVIEFAKYPVRGEDGELRMVGGGSFRNPTVEGQSTGFGCMLGIVDDPLKGRKEARSPTIRQNVWDWLMESFFSRFADQAGLLMIMTRWHKDDAGGRFIERYPNTRVIAFPAIAKHNEYIRHPNGERVLLRKKGEALFPEHKSIDFLLLRRQGYTTAGWESVYQQSPIIQGGGEFPVENFTVIPAINRREIKKSVRYWDKAGTDDGGKRTAGVLMHLMFDGTYTIESCVSGQWSALPREVHIKQCAENDKVVCKNVRTFVEQEPGSGGKESAEATVRMLRGHRIYADKVTGSKEDRAEPYAAQVQNKGVKLLAGPWVTSFLDEHEVWPNGPFMDKVDASAGAFNKLNVGSYDSSFSWVRD
jgi:phage terminase large subunit-like protein